MKIDTTPATNVRPASPDAASPRTQASSSTAPAAAAPAESAPAGGDANVNLSSLSTNLRLLAASGSADIDTAKVQSIRDAIKNGSLTIDTGKIADGILQTASELLRTPASLG
ncbi:flagellar biosynthesis anti-sigma factor FlgM [Burkholderia glumae]|uniref:Negative regulator of flagellin synthesis n=1 Tax=Burkholderia glumae TaxID=337 RepID=A0AAQ0BUV1_BURGL|nr:flagellar biosynthesis anti-sigma factor FlgM [Burkholderia glumae]ACR30381.1 Negative regulator of flagellin synthesis FlgM [Burkholderia glumae BGR1]AJY66568.1 flagellar biosynthesis anti-sigma factor FlgM [Burkholderia glumae LMG 2196 = ATCC 33617]KHJ64268.1 flagellar biosynthesis anti-sigma factor FlgM [Burkholderia glumae]MCM2481967.1 flagellar biosynthesis anti-sigma factor FlgM [Burkholderia glumae]MCM2491435.1 flagellar biosynthesis anti-sigma factor FlgM [Burkholderia glumae]